jgi:hypothetical protein
MMSLVPLTAANPVTTFCNERESVISESQRRNKRRMNSCSAGSGPDPHGDIGGLLLMLPPKYECGDLGMSPSGGELGESVMAHLAIPGA